MVGGELHGDGAAHRVPEHERVRMSRASMSLAMPSA